MRVIKSSWQSEDIEDTDLQDALTEAILAKTRYPNRTSYSRDQYGQTVSECSMTSYTTPDGTERYAVYLASNDGDEYTDTHDQAEATAYYEEQVRDLSTCGTDDEPWWSVSDVEGVLQSAYVYEVEVSDDGSTWTVDEEGNGELDRGGFEEAAEQIIERVNDGERLWRVSLWAGTNSNGEPTATDSNQITYAIEATTDEGQIWQTVETGTEGLAPFTTPKNTAQTILDNWITDQESLGHPTIGWRALVWFGAEQQTADMAAGRAEAL